MSQIKNNKCRTNLKTNKTAIANLQCIPSIGPKVGEMLVEVGISKISDLRNQKSEDVQKSV